MRATIYTIDDNGAEKPLATYTLENGVAIGKWAKGSTDHFREQVENDGIYGRGGKLYFPADGEKFIKALEFNFANSSRITARIT